MQSILVWSSYIFSRVHLESFSYSAINIYLSTLVSRRRRNLPPITTGALLFSLPQCDLLGHSSCSSESFCTLNSIYLTSWSLKATLSSLTGVVPSARVSPEVELGSCVCRVQASPESRAFYNFSCCSFLSSFACFNSLPCSDRRSPAHVLMVDGFFVFVRAGASTSFRSLSFYALSLLAWSRIYWYVLLPLLRARVTRQNWQFESPRESL